MRIIAAVILLFSSILCAEERPLASFGPFGNLASRPIDYRDGDWIYREYFNGKDDYFSKIYRDRWNYHEAKVPFAGVDWRGEHLAIGSLDYFDRAPNESEVRHHFAEEVLRIRVDDAIRKYLEKEDRAPGLKRASRTIQRAKNYRLIKTEDHDEIPTELILGYDVLTDRSRFEYLYGPLSAGVSHPRLISSLAGARREVLVHFASDPMPELIPNSRVNYYVGDRRIEVVFNRHLSERMVTSLTTSRTIDFQMPWSYKFEITYHLAF